MPMIDFTQRALERAIEATTTRQQVLAGNVANANTPGYVRRDVEFHDALASASDAAGLDDLVIEPRADASAVRRADGGGVDVEQENAALAANALEHQTYVTVARARIEILQAALGTR